MKTMFGTIRCIQESVKTRMRTQAILLLLAAIAILANNIVPVDAKLSCSSTKECEERLRIGSKCVDGFCSNPFVEGCLKTMLGSREMEEIEKMNLAPKMLGALDGRVCNSDDNKKSGSEDEDEDGATFCFDNDFNYFEIRIHNANWDSSIFVAWIMQIMLMEVLKVPATVGLNSNVTNASSFYSPINSLPYSSDPYPWHALHGGDCESTDQDCVDVLPEVWNGQLSKWISMIQEGLVEPVDGCGQVGKLGWFIPGSTAKRDTSLVSYYGLQGDENREKLAKAFKRPTTWQEYCEEVSINNCTSPDEVAEHYPSTESQTIKYFEDGQFTGYFRMLPENNCTEFPDTCSGYMVAPVCTWSTNVDAQIYWNDIVGLKVDGPSLPNEGYVYSSMIEIWRAANATKSDVVMWWWQPEAMVEEFSATDWNFQQIILPTVTDVCFESRINVDDRCEDDITTRRGDPLGACDDEAHALQKIISASLQKKTLIEEEPSRSPGYPFVRSMKITDIEIQAILNKWMAINTDMYGNDAREAVCSWVIEHMDTLLGFIPSGHPRKLDSFGSFNEGYLYFVMAIAVFDFLAILAIARFAYRHRLTKVFAYAQETFVRIILLGFLLVIVGGFLFAIEPTNMSCIVRNWLTNLGFSMVLSAVLVKMSAINRIMQSSKRLKRVKVSHKDMLRSLGFLVMINLIFLIAWTAISPPLAIKKLVLPEEQEPYVESSMICRSRQLIWPYMSEGWRSMLLIVASVLAFQSRGIIPDFNESRSIGTMIYSHFLFMILRVIVFVVGMAGFLTPNVFGACISILYTFDTLFATAIYVIPKCIEANKDPRIHDPRASLRSTEGLNRFSRYSDSRFSCHSSLNGDSKHNRRVIHQSASLEFNCESDFIPTSNLRGRQQTRHTSFSTNGALSSDSFSNHEIAMNYNSVLEDPPSNRSLKSIGDEDSIKEEVKFDFSDGGTTAEPDQIKSLFGSNRSLISIEGNENSIMEDVESNLSDGETAIEPDQMKSSIVSNGTFSPKNLLTHDASTANDDEVNIHTLEVQNV